MPSFPADAIIDLATSHLASADIPGATIALIVDGEPWTVAVGHADLDRTRPLAPKAVFPLYSITKTIVATLLLHMIERKESMSLDDTLQQRLRDFPIDHPILIRQVLNHTAGLPDYGSIATYHRDLQDHPDQPWSPSRFLAETLTDGLLFIPGHGWQYSNIGYMLLRLIVEAESGLPLSLLLQQVLVSPYGLTSFGVATRLAEMHPLTPGFSTSLNPESRIENVTSRYHPGWVAHGLVVGNALDTARFLWLLLGERRILDAILVNEMLLETPVDTTHPWMRRPAYGLGVMIDRANPYGVVAGHTGGGPGYSTAAYHFPAVNGRQVTATVLVNRDGADTASELVFQVIEHLATS